MPDFKRKLSKVLDLTKELYEILNHMLDSDLIDEEHLKRFDEVLTLRGKILKELKDSKNVPRNLDNMRIEIENYERRIVERLCLMKEKILKELETNSQTLEILKKYSKISRVSDNRLKTKFDKEA